MGQLVNRIAEALKVMEARHNRLKKQFSPEIFNSRTFKKEQIREMVLLRNRFKSGLNSEEKIYRRLLNARRKQLEKELYPNAYLRLSRNLLKLSGQLIAFPIKKMLQAQNTSGRNWSHYDNLNDYQAQSLPSKVHDKSENQVATFLENKQNTKENNVANKKMDKAKSVGKRNKLNSANQQNTLRI